MKNRKYYQRKFDEWMKKNKENLKRDIENAILEFGDEMENEMDFCWVLFITPFDTQSLEQRFEDIKKLFGIEIQEDTLDWYLLDEVIDELNESLFDTIDMDNDYIVWFSQDGELGLKLGLEL